ncbi:cytochrome c [Dechloromonas sp. ARDL1]|uniref:c-type cytochrome n=1 Tax=Dechloromonas sp. ARDL1 TaxID=3322121 RepID=UPI003DA75F8F
MSALLAFSASLWAEVARYEEPIRYRRAVMTMIKRHYEQVSAMAKGKAAMNREELNRHANYLEMLSRASIDGFVAGSHEGETKAKPEIWQDWPRFRSQIEKFQADATRLKEIARGGNLEALKTAVSDMTRTCKNCHDDYKTSSL